AREVAAAPVEPRDEPPPRRDEPRQDGGRTSAAPYGAPQSFDISTMSLSAIGVRSRAKAWGVILGTALLLIGLGALGAWLLMRPATPGDAGDAVAQADPAPPPDPLPPDEVEIGDPLPEGAEPPDEVITGSPRPR